MQTGGGKIYSLLEQKGVDTLTLITGEGRKKECGARCIRWGRREKTYDLLSRGERKGIDSPTMAGKGAGISPFMLA